VEEILSTISSWIWDPMAYFVLGLGVVFTIGTKAVQFRKFPDMLRQVREGESSTSGLTPFQALMLALSSRVGVGSIAGVATAIGFGGPGALMWMALTGLVGSSVGYAEAVLAQTFKERVDGEDRGGMPYYIKYGLKAPRIAAFVGGIGLLGYAFIFPGLQVNTIATSANKAFGVEPWITGIAVSAVLAVVIIGGTKRIVRTAQILVPVLAIGYLLTALTVIAFNITKVPEAITLIVTSAFGVNQIFAGIVGAAVSWGVRRAIFASANGNGEATFAAAAAQVSHPGKQGLVQSFSIYIDVLLICMATGIMIVLSGTYNVSDGHNGFLMNGLPGVTPGPNFVQAAIDTMVPGWGSGFVAVAVLLFGFTCQLFYFYVATTNLVFLLGNRKSKVADAVLKIGALAISFFGAVVNATSMWAIGDIGFGIIGWLNMLCLVFMAPMVFRICKDYDRQKKLGLDPVFDPKALNIRGATFWETSQAEHAEHKVEEPATR
jgi:AGCS family alanine or glycine:cation symporter